MKALVSALLISFVSFSASARSIIPVKSFKDASLNVCAKGMLGCAHTINLDGKKTALAVDEDSRAAEQTINTLIGNAQFHKMKQTAPFTVKGYYTERGVFPNPMVKRTVFVVLEVSDVKLAR